MRIQSGVTIHGYELLERIGSGGFGAVYRAWDLQMQGPCALKQNLVSSPDERLPSRGKGMSRKVLIIEDRRENIVFIANNILKPEGWEVITARDGKLGLQKAIEEQPDLIISDLKLPTMHGLDVLENLNKRGYRIPTIVMTFHGSEELVVNVFRKGVKDYVIKPFQVTENSLNFFRHLCSIRCRGYGSSSPYKKGISHNLT